MRIHLIRSSAAALALCCAHAHADTTPQTPPFSQNWSNTGLITTANDWSSVPGIAGYLGDNAASSNTGVDPRTLLTDLTNTLNVQANQNSVTVATSGGAAEFEFADPAVAIKGSGTADAPYLLISINNTGLSGTRVSFNMRDLDDTATDAIQPINVQYRVGNSGAFTNVTGGYFADVSVPNATQVTPAEVFLPAAADNQAVVQVRIMTTNAAGVDEWIGIDDITVGPSVDVPPTVSSSAPNSASAAIAVNSNLVINFSEAVTVSGSWFTIQCATSGAHTAVVSGGPSSYTLNPDTDFAFGEACVWTTIAANVSDQDGTPNVMATNYVVNFNAVQDVAPSVATISPANSASNVQLNANITVNFDEPVSVTGAWYQLNCSVSGNNLAATVTGGPQSYVVDPTANLANSENCTFTVIAANVTDLDGTPQVMANNFVSTFSTVPNASNYYAGVNASSPATLRTSLHSLIRGHTCYFYSGAGTNVWTILEDADQAPGAGNENKVLDVYKNALYNKGTDRAGVNNDPITSFNREHTWPNSYGFNDRLTATGTGGATFANCPYTDTHMLYASNVSYNSSRGNLIFDDCAGCASLETEVNAGQGGPGFPNRFVAGSPGTGKFEVWQRRKGDMARAILYMDIRYEGGTHPTTGISEPDLIVTNATNLITTTGNGAFVAQAYMGRLDTLIAWHLADPPTAEEVARNGKVFTYQGNRNPFIDHPEWVACIYQNQCGSGSENLFANGFENP